MAYVILNPILKQFEDEDLKWRRLGICSCGSENLIHAMLSPTKNIQTYTIIYTYMYIERNGWEEDDG